MTKKKKDSKGREKKSDAPKGAYRLELVAEAGIKDLLKDADDDRHEASGVHYEDGRLYVVVDNAPRVVAMSTDVEAPFQSVTLIEVSGEGNGYEDITYQPFEKRWYCLIEADEAKPDQLKPRVDSFDEFFEFAESFWLDFPLESDNKGIEGLSYLRYQGEDFLLGLCEGNACKGGKKGRKPGKGRIQLFRRAPEEWAHAGTIKLPKSAQFEDYAGLDYLDRQVAVLSQETSAVWIGRVREHPQGLDDLWEDDGVVLSFPPDSNGRTVYCNLEGITWLDKRTLAVVSDRAKRKKQPKRCKRKDESIHIFSLMENP